MSPLKLIGFYALRSNVCSVIVMITSHQLGGIHLVYFYMERIYTSTGVQQQDMWYIATPVTTLLVLVTVVMIYVIDCGGRRFPLLLGLGICSLSCVSLTVSLELQSNIPWMSYVSTAFAILFLFGQAIGPATSQVLHVPRHQLACRLDMSSEREEVSTSRATSEEGGKEIKLKAASRSKSEEEPEEAPTRKKPTTTLILIVLMTAFGSSFQYGYNLWGINHPFALSREFFNKNFEHMTDFTEQQKTFRRALLVSFFYLGALVGSLFVRFLAEKCGRKGAMMINNLLSVFAAIALSSSNYMMETIYYYQFSLFSRGITGVCAGIFSSVVPMYLGEIAPQSLRGAIIMVAQLFVAVGVLVAQILGLPAILGSPKGWPLYLSFTGILAIFQLFLLPSFPESPRYLLICKADEKKARQALRMLRGEDDVEDEIEDLHDEDMAEMPEKDMDIFKLLVFPDLRWQLLTVIMLMIGRELSGINAAYYYAELLYVNSTGVTTETLRYLSMASTVVVIITLIITIFLIDTVGRRTLLLTGLGICCITCILLTMCIELQSTFPWMSYISMVMIVIFITGHVIGPSPIPDIFVTELFFQSSRSSAFAIGGFVEWLCSFCSGFAFVYIKDTIGAYCFFVFWPFCLANFIYVFKVIPETMNKSFLEIRRVMTIHVLKIVLRKSKGSSKRMSRRATQRSIKRNKQRASMFP
ncbi:hypothetical protein lerEdw1_003121 [Lerista edwardsae]|nr:hypothetical protein lerEdw1_003121 [Lerista edwardsae]